MFHEMRVIVISLSTVELLKNVSAARSQVSYYNGVRIASRMLFVLKFVYDIRCCLVY